MVDSCTQPWPKGFSFDVLFLPEGQFMEWYDDVSKLSHVLPIRMKKTRRRKLRNFPNDEKYLGIAR